MATEKQGKAIQDNVCLYANHWDFIIQYAIENKITWNGRPSVSGALQAIINDAMENKGMGEK